MRYKDFKMVLKQELERSTTNTIEVHFDTIDRNNGTVKDVIQIQEVDFNITTVSIT